MYMHTLITTSSWYRFRGASGPEHAEGKGGSKTTIQLGLIGT